ncbi:MAG: hypothetical protein ACRCZJ_01145 [Erysipelotrichaceae bacterium]
MKPNQEIKDLISEELSNVENKPKFKVIRVEDEPQTQAPTHVLERVKSESKEVLDQFVNDEQVQVSVQKVVDQAMQIKELVSQKTVDITASETFQNETKKAKEAVKSAAQSYDSFLHTVGESDVVVDVVRKILDTKEDVLQRPEVKEAVEKGKDSLVNFGEKGLRLLKKTLHHGEDQ